MRSTFDRRSSCRIQQGCASRSEETSATASPSAGWEDCQFCDKKGAHPGQQVVTITYSFVIVIGVPHYPVTPMLKRLILKFGSTGASDPLSFEPSGMTVLVGPNNSGKSLFLNELALFLKNGGLTNGKLKHTHIIDSIAPAPIDEPEAAELMGSVPRVRDESGREIGGQFQKVEPLTESDFRVGYGASPFTTHLAGNSDVFLMAFVWLFTVVLDGYSRISLTLPREFNDLQNPPKNILDALFRDHAARARVSKITHEAFGYYFVIDPTGLTNFRIRLSRRPPSDVYEEQALDARARTFHAEAAPITDFSDGIKAFVGMCAAIMMSNYRVIVVDEPEAFLHPPLARRLGSTLASIAAERQGNVFAATHSAEFLIGCIQAGMPVNVIRLTYKNGAPTARMLNSETLRGMMLDPLLRSSGVLGGLFFESVVVCEADADRAFYSEVNERMLASGHGGAPDALFLNAHSWQTVGRIVRPLRSMGVPAVAIVDLDVIKRQGTEWEGLLAPAGIPKLLIESLSTLRGQVLSRLNATVPDWKRVGIRGLGRTDLTAAEELIETLARFGVFLVPCGELECWLPSLRIPLGNKADWLVQVFEKMGTDPSEPGYLGPSIGDVWDFMQKVAAWIRDPRRKGMPH